MDLCELQNKRLIHHISPKSLLSILVCVPETLIGKACGHDLGMCGLKTKNGPIMRTS